MVSIIKVNEIQNQSGTSAMTIDSSGRVTRSVLPAWRVGLANNQSETTSGDHVVEFDTDNAENCFLQGGCTHSSGVITVPIAGLYFLSSTIRFNNVTSTNFVIVKLQKNGVTTGLSDAYALSDDHGSSYESVMTTDLFQCEAGDELRVQVNVQSDTSWHLSADNCHFNGFMVG